MTYFILALIAVILLLSGGLAIAVKAAQKKGKRVMELEADIAAERAKLKRQEEYRKKKEEAQKNADEKKDTLHTGDAAADFGNSLDMLHGAGKNRGN